MIILTFVSISDIEELFISCVLSIPPIVIVIYSTNKVEQYPLKPSSLEACVIGTKKLVE